MLESNRLDAGVWGLPGTVPYPPQAPSAGVEPATSGIATRRSDPMSYEGGRGRRQNRTGIVRDTTASSVPLS